ncbi:MAG: polynucleotide adenylyltransferase, partial [Clostridia bacterium]|nr:polynucleotide adenylyltransferase [Clostridia bacterium]
MTIPDFAAAIVSTIESAGFEAWLVGGCVRDALLGQEPGDYDIATNALPQQTAALFARSVPTGERYGTITVLLEGGKAEVTTFRLEGGYTDHRRPDDVTFTSGIEADLARRDFTVNAMAFSSARGLFDPFGGRSDLGARLIRAVGDPSARFREDALRILRAFRFSAQLGFAIEPCTLQAAADAAPLVGHVSRERVRDELQKLLVSTNPHVIFELLRAGVDCGVFHGLAGPGEGASRLDTAPCAPSARWAGFFALCGVSQAAAAELAATLKLDRLLTRRILALLEALAQPLPQGRAQIKRRLAGASPELL